MKEQAAFVISPVARQALLNRARAGILLNVAHAGEMADTLSHWRGYARAIKEMTCGAADKLAAKDARLGGYQLPSHLKGAAGCLDVNVESLTRAQVAHLLAQAGVEIPAHAVADLNLVAAHDFEDGDVATSNLDGEHPAPRVAQADASGAHEPSLTGGSA